MSTNRARIEAPPHVVFAVLADPWSYQRWVVGTKAIRSADTTWPLPGSSFQHTLGIGPLVVKDATRVIERDGDRRITLSVGVGRFGGGTVTISLRPIADDSTEVTLREVLDRGPVATAWFPLGTTATWLRNRVTLGRLRDEVLRRGRAPAARPGPRRQRPVLASRSHRRVAVGSAPG